MRSPKKRGKAAGLKPQEKQTAQFSVDSLYEQARSDGRWSEMFEVIEKGEAEKDARLRRALKFLRDNPEQVEPIRIVMDTKNRNIISIDDGFHRIVAAKLLGWKEITTEVFPSDIGSDCPKCGKRVKAEVKTDRTICPICGATISHLKIRARPMKTSVLFEPKSRRG